MSSSELVAAGWKRTASGRWWHASFPGPEGRKRLFTTDAATSLLQADPTKPLPLAAFSSMTDEDPED